MKESNKTEPKPYMGTVKLGPKGQIVIPKEIRDMFGIEPGDAMIIMAHPQRGIALERPSVLTKVADAIFAGKGADLYPEDKPENLAVYAENIKNTISGKEDEK